MAKRALTYKDAGVDVTANARWVERIRHAMHETYGPRVISRHNAFAGMFRLDYDEQLFRRNYRQPVLVACADGVGSKLTLAIEMGDLSTVGIDLVAMNVNDMITCGAEPLFFLDYLAVHKIEPEQQLALMESIAAGCRESGCALLGGETAELPDVYKPGDIDLGGFAVGVVELTRALDPERVEPGDVLIGLPSSGIHSNGYTLVRRIITQNRLKLDREYDNLGETLGAAALRPTRIYVRTVGRLLKSYRRKKVISAMAHITGGGLAENLARVIPGDCDAVIERKRWTPPPIFPFLQKHGIARQEMFRVFNMGIGYIFVVRPTFANGVTQRLKRLGETPITLGKVKRGKGKVTLR
ncbi:MAG: phosphoribosylformylglycinamidine cyclo-ligase [Phycisphaerales bacterium]|nr:phosphoribosylformylglycinamidine cyclo-ligase [Phycisphaerales bacterium]